MPLTNFEVDEDYSKLTIDLLYEESIVIDLLSIDYVIFKLLSKNMKYYDFVKNAEEFLDHGFPKEEIKNYVEVLWQRISIFISYGIFHPLSTEEFENIINKKIVFI